MDPEGQGVLPFSITDGQASSFLQSLLRQLGLLRSWGIMMYLTNINLLIILGFVVHHTVTITKGGPTEVVIVICGCGAVLGFVFLVICQRNEEKSAMATTSEADKKWCRQVSKISGKIGFAFTVVGLITGFCLYLPGKFTWIPFLIVIVTVCLVLY